MKKVLLLTAAFMPYFLSSAQGNDVTLAVIAWEKGHVDNAWENANAALQSPGGLNKNLLYKAYSIRGKAGTRISYHALTEGNDNALEKYAGIALQAYRDFKEILHAKDTALINDIKQEFHRLGHALLLSGTDYDKINADKEKPDSLLLEKAIECYSATIELWELAGKEKYKPYYYRGDALLAKRQYDKAMADLEKAMSMFISATRKLPDLGIGDLGYRLAYTQAGVFNNKPAARKTIEKTKELLDGEMQLAEAKKDIIADQYEDLKAQYDYLIGELNSLLNTVEKHEK